MTHNRIAPPPIVSPPASSDLPQIQVSPPKRPQTRGWPSWWIPAGLVGLTLVTAGVAWKVVTGRNPVQAVTEAANGTPEQQAVRAWLKENTNTGEWEEVKWWAAYSARGGRVWKGGVENDRYKWQSVSHSPLWETIKDDRQAVRLKFRFQNGLGGMSIDDHVFFVLGGAVVDQRDVTDYVQVGQTRPDD